jgi:hypothetical protein
VAADLCLRPCSHWDWQWSTNGVNKENVPVPTITYWGENVGIDLKK